MTENIQLTYDEQQRLKTCSTTDYIWQYGSNPELQLQMLFWERVSCRDDIAGPQATANAAAMVVHAAAQSDTY